MRFLLARSFLWLPLLALLTAGCGPVENQVKKSEPRAAAESKHNYKGRDWCAEHGLPESTCSMCSAKVAAKFKAKGDWCEKHERAKSQCFLCDPKLKEKFAAEYRAQYGEDPPPIEEEEKDAAKKK